MLRGEGELSEAKGVQIGLCDLVLLVKQGIGERKDDELSVSAGYDGC